MTLAEQLELGQIMFELWVNFTDPYNKAKSEVLIGTCTLPLEPLLENRIGIRGWFPIKSVHSTDQPLLTSLANDRDVGALEVALRFTKADDFLRVIDAARQLGWYKQEEQSKQAIESNYPKSFGKNDTFKLKCSENVNETLANKKGLKCLVEIEKAVHLPLVFDEKLNLKVPPNAFVTFNTINEHNQTESTKLIDRYISPTWNFQTLAQLDQEYFLDNNKYFMLKVWHRNHELGKNKLLGCVSVDMTPLVCGLAQINGWYNINDSVGQVQGQLKLMITPQECVTNLKQLYEKRKANSKKISSGDNLTDTRLLSNRMETYSQCSFASLSSTQTYSGNEMSRQRLASTASTSELTTSTSSAPIKTLIKDTNELKIGLAQKLSELDNLNRMLKERLESKRGSSSFKSNPTISNETRAQPEVITNQEKLFSDFGAQASFESSRKSVELTQPVIELNDKINHEQDDSKKAQSEEVVTIAETHVNPNNSAADSFWTSFYEANNAQVEEVSEKSDHEYVIVEHLPPIPHVSQINKTFFTQTFKFINFCLIIGCFKSD